MGSYFEHYSEHPQIRIHRRVFGSCPRCEVPFDVTLGDGEDGLPAVFRCPCGGFSYDTSFPENVTVGSIYSTDYWRARRPSEVK